MAVAFRSSSSVNYGLKTVSTFTAPSGIVDGDILLIAFFTGFLTADTVYTVTMPSGFTVISGPSMVSDGAFNGYRQLAWKPASGESGSYTVTHQGTNNFRTGGVMACVSGGDATATPIFSTNGHSNGDGGTAYDSTVATSITTPANSSWVGFIVHNWAEFGAAAPPGGTTPTFTERLDYGDMWYVADGVLATAGATGDKTQSPNLNPFSQEGWGAFLVGIGPQVAAVGQPTVKRFGGIPHMRRGQHSIW